MNRIEIWQPRWHDRKVLIAKDKVREENEIVFTKTKSLPSTVHYFLSGEEIRKHPLGTNGVIPCYEVPLDVVLEAPKKEEIRVLPTPPSGVKEPIQTTIKI
jgi:hypothetical protein